MYLCDQHFLKDACYSPIGDSDSALVILRELLEQVGGRGNRPKGTRIKDGTYPSWTPRLHIPNGLRVSDFSFFKNKVLLLLQIDLQRTQGIHGHHQELGLAEGEGHVFSHGGRS